MNLRKIFSSSIQMGKIVMKAINLLHMCQFCHKHFNLINWVINLLTNCQYSSFNQFWSKIIDVNANQPIWHDLSTLTWKNKLIIFWFFFFLCFSPFFSLVGGRRPQARTSLAWARATSLSLVRFDKGGPHQALPLPKWGPARPTLAWTRVTSQGVA